jgi:nitrous oxidase accessory protein NosD
MRRSIFSTFSALVALVLMFTLAMPITALADDGQPGDPTPEATQEAPADDGGTEAEVTEELPPPEIITEGIAATEENVALEGVEEILPSPEVITEEIAATEPVVNEETVAEVVDLIAETESLMVNVDGEPVSLTNDGVAEILSNPDPFIVRGGVTYRFLLPGGCAAYPGELGTTCFETTTRIQDAINFANDGETVVVEAGNYNEQLVIGKSITLSGAGAGLTNLNEPGLLVADADGVTSLVQFTGVGTVAELSGFTVTASNALHALYMRDGVNANIHDNVIVGGYVAIEVGRKSKGETGSATIVDNQISGYGKNGITVDNTGSSATITGNTITGMGLTDGEAQNGIQISRGATANIGYNQITNNIWTRTYGGSNDPATDSEADGATGILLYMSGSGVSIHHNTLTGNQFGIWTVAAPDVLIQNNTITGYDATGSDFPTGIAIWSADMWTTGLGGSEVGTAALIQNNIIAHHEYGVLVRDYTVGGPAPSVTLSGNSFANNDIQAQATGDTIYDAYAVVTGNFFDRSVVVVHPDLSYEPIVWSAIQDGIDAATGGDTAFVGAGTYIENVQIDKSITLQGSGQSSTVVMPAVSNPISCPGVCPAELGTNTVIWVRADWVSISDLTVEGDNPSLNGVPIGGADVDAHNGIITITNTNLTVQYVTVQDIYERGIQIGTTGGTFNFSNNIVDNVQGSDYSIGIFNRMGGGVISGNVVTNANDAISANWSTGTAFVNNQVFQSGSGIHTDNTQGLDVIIGNTIANGKPNSYGIFVFAPYQPVVINGNGISNVDYGLTLSGNGWNDPLNTITFDSNSVDANVAAAYITTDVWGYFSSNVLGQFTFNTLTSDQYGFYLESQGLSETPYGPWVCTGNCILTVLANGNVITTPTLAMSIFMAIGETPWYGGDPDYNGIYNFISLENNTWLTDADGDGVTDDNDNCTLIANVDQTDADLDGQGDACDAFPLDPDNDADGDGVGGDVDGCPANYNPGQEDTDGDGVQDVCDAFPNDPNNDTDGDSVSGEIDNCPSVANADQANTDGDAFGNACDAWPNDPNNDADGDGASGEIDNCPSVANPGQEDRDADGIGDACDTFADVDHDGVMDGEDNCQSVANPGQEDTDTDGIGDACDTFADIDHDGVMDSEDNCPSAVNAGQSDADHDGIGSACDETPYGEPVNRPFDGFWDGEFPLQTKFFELQVMSGSATFEVDEDRAGGDHSVAVDISPDGEMPTIVITYKMSQPGNITVTLPDGTSTEIPTTCTPAPEGNGYLCAAVYTPSGSEASLHPVFSFDKE